jgi:transposase, IS5 family
VSRSAASQLSFADWELMRQGLELEPLLKAIADFLDDHEELVGRIRGDLRRGLKDPDTGRSGMAPREVLRSLVLMRVKNWDYRELRERIADGYTLRLFTGFRSRPVPKHTAFHRAFVRLTPATLRAINELVVKAAVDLGLEDGSKLRVDTTVVQTDIHYPTDATLLWDVVRVLSRLLGRLGKLRRRRIKGFRNRTRAARRRMQILQRMSATQRRGQQTAKYRELIGIAGEVVSCAQAALAQRRAASSPNDLLGDLAIAGLHDEIAHYCSLADRVIDQARRRVLDGEQVPNAEKIYSIFEPHTDLIKRGKVRTPVEFGHKVFLAESARGLITQYRVLEGNPPDQQHVGRSLHRHDKTFDRVPELYSADRGFFSECNLMLCEHSGVELACIPQSGGNRSPERDLVEKAAAFKQGQRFRAGIEGRISVLFRGRGMKRCLAEGIERFELLVGAAVLANNLMSIASWLTKPAARRRRAA